ncbi:hypothetical protein EVAR_72775_1 [Eumeta japonica]|uniref:Uncharacterized protein n=1 Tax=Eumeta variegata TaxID=151549 RepID=A0A4C2AF25_EUMVA|nr:hypothetical protein EVAR_72775_1 [Eumeta japonica]
METLQWSRVHTIKLSTLICCGAGLAGPAICPGTMTNFIGQLFGKHSALWLYNVPGRRNLVKTSCFSSVSSFCIASTCGRKVLNFTKSAADEM